MTKRPDGPEVPKLVPGQPLWGPATPEGASGSGDVPPAPSRQPRPEPSRPPQPPHQPPHQAPPHQPPRQAPSRQAPPEPAPAAARVRAEARPPGPVQFGPDVPASASGVVYGDNKPRRGQLRALSMTTVVGIAAGAFLFGAILGFAAAWLLL